MACFKPLEAYRTSRCIDIKSGKPKILFKAPHHWPGYETLYLPCGQCTGCRHDRASARALRCMHEASMHEDNCFITLTFDDKHLDKKNSLNKSDFQNFIKRLRKFLSDDIAIRKFCKESGWKDEALESAVKYLHKRKILYYHAGEYGEENQRPHHHAILFNFDFIDKEPIGLNALGSHNVYNSKLLDKLWQNQGFTQIGSVTYESCAYVARYCLKKITGPTAPDHYQGRVPEYNTMSLKPAIGQTWYDKFKSDLFPADKAVTPNGNEISVPSFYRKKFEIDDPVKYAELKAIRLEKAKNNPDNKPERLKAREVIKKQQLDKLKRVL